MSTFVDIHVLQSVPPSCINRDDTGSPKSAVYGGVQRARVSSQSWKNAVRSDFKLKNDPRLFGRRTKRVVAEVAEQIRIQAPQLASDAVELASAAFSTAGVKVTEPKRKKAKATSDDGDAVTPESGYLLFLSAAQVSNVAEQVVALHTDGGLDAVKGAKKELKALLQQDHSVDIALFGRMVAEDKDLNVDAACQVAHAISTHKAKSEFDFFTAVDDAKSEKKDEDAGAGMMGTVEFNSSTLYRFATVSLDGLKANLGSDEATVDAVRQFADSFIRSMPTGKANTFANRTLPDVVVIAIRDDQPMSWVGAFEKPVSTRDQGYVAPSVSSLVKYVVGLNELYDHPALACVGSTMPEYSAELARIASLGSVSSTLDALVDVISPIVSQQ